MATRDPRDSPGVHFPPPLIYLAGYVAGWSLTQLWPLPLTPELPSRASILTMKALMAIGLILILASLFSFARYRTALPPTVGASRLITSGLYRISRNPIYLGFTSIYLGATLRANSIWALVFLVPVFWIMNRYVIEREEEHLAAVFGDAYSTYCRRVRRWL